jgi:Copper amine oxidase, enzyme domain
MKTTIALEAAGPGPAMLADVREKLLASSALKTELAKGAKLLSFQVTESHKQNRTPGPFDSLKAVLYNYQDNYAIHATAKLGAPDKVQLRRSALQPLPTATELATAMQLAAANPNIREAIDTGRAQLFPGMPGIMAVTQPNGSTKRKVPLVLQPAARHDIPEILAVDLQDGSLVRGVATQPARAEFFQERILPVPKAALSFPTINANSTEQVWFTIIDADSHQTLWKMLVVRPAASSGLNGSGLELRYVDYKGRRVLHRAHTPIWNVIYENRVQEYRDWNNQESGFDAKGTFFKDAQGNTLENFILCDSEPKTVFETGEDGSFTGVAFFQNPDGSWTLSTVMTAGWYRYYMAYTFFDDGTIKPRIGFTTNGTNPYAGISHYHNCYFRFDFDIDNAGNNTISTDQASTHWDTTSQAFVVSHTKTPLSFETRLNRQPLATYLVENNASKRGYRVVPGNDDGTAATDTYNFSKGDIWALLYHDNEMDDGVPQLSYPADAQLDKFVTGEPIAGKDVVLWYAVHFTHDPLHTTGEKDFGPTLQTVGRW